MRYFRPRRFGAYKTSTVFATTFVRELHKNDRYKRQVKHYNNHEKHERKKLVAVEGYKAFNTISLLGWVLSCIYLVIEVINSLLHFHWNNGLTYALIAFFVTLICGHATLQEVPINDCSDDNK